jgi:hypothetical protein
VSLCWKQHKMGCYMTSSVYSAGRCLTLSNHPRMVCYTVYGTRQPANQPGWPVLLLVPDHHCDLESQRSSCVPPFIIARDRAVHEATTDSQQ